jgi:hypothetical protein
MEGRFRAPLKLRLGAVGAELEVMDKASSFASVDPAGVTESLSMRGRRDEGDPFARPRIVTLRFGTDLGATNDGSTPINGAVCNICDSAVFELDMGEDIWTR